MATENLNNQIDRFLVNLENTNNPKDLKELLERVVEKVLLPNKETLGELLAPENPPITYDVTEDFQNHPSGINYFRIYPTKRVVIPNVLRFELGTRRYRSFRFPNGDGFWYEVTHKHSQLDLQLFSDSGYHGYSFYTYKEGKVQSYILDPYMYREFIFALLTSQQRLLKDGPKSTFSSNTES